MNASSFLLAAALSFPILHASAQTLVAVPAAQELSGSRPAAPAARPATAGSVRYFGVVTSQDARHEQFGQLQRAFEAFQPTLVVIEKPDLGTAETEAATIATKGVPGYTRLLAQQHQVATERLDNPDAEYAYLRTKVDAEQLKLYYLLREARRFQQRTGASTTVMAKAMQALITNSASFLPGTEQVIHNLVELQTAYHKYCPTGGQWQDAPTTYFCPQAAVALYPSGSFAHTINAAIGEYREQHMYSQLAARAAAGERILVVVSCDQLPATQAAAGAVAVK